MNPYKKNFISVELIFLTFSIQLMQKMDFIFPRKRYPVLKIQISYTFQNINNIGILCPRLGAE